MIYLMFFVLSFLFWASPEEVGEVITLELGNYVIILNLYFVIFICAFLLFTLIKVMRIYSSILLKYVNIKNMRKDREYLLFFEALFSIDLGNTESAYKIFKCLDEKSNKLSLINFLNSGKIANYAPFFTRILVSIAMKNRSLALLLVNKLIVQFKQERGIFQRFIEYCTSSINDKILSIPFQIESCVLQENWSCGIMKLKEAAKFNVVLPFDHNRMLAVFYCALAKQYENNGSYKDAIKALFRAQSHCKAFQPINYLKASLYIKLGKLRKASAILETEYTVNPTPDSARIYVNLNNKKGAERLCDLRPDYYFSYYLLAISSISIGKYALASKQLEIAMQKANYISIYLIMIHLKIALQEYDRAFYFLERIRVEALSDPCWKCESCDKHLDQWHYRCSGCSSFNCVYYAQ